MKGTVNYIEKWSTPSNSQLTCVGFSRAGSLVAYGGIEGLTIASVDSGKIQAVVQNQRTPVVALKWLHGDAIACAFSDGAVARVTLSPVSELSRLGSCLALTPTVDPAPYCRAGCSKAYHRVHRSRRERSFYVFRVRL